MDSILQGLNDAQRTAVASPSPVLQVLAPPGSGKTKTLTARVAYLISHEGYRPWNIIVCTFTIKAAREMKERIRGFVGEDLEKKLILGTFHSVARRYLVSYGHYIGIKRDFGIADSSDTLSILKRIKQRHKYNIEPGVARSRISKIKAGNAEQKMHNGVEKQEFDAIHQEYQETLEASNLLDYDDLLLKCKELLQSHQDCVSNVEAVLIDEFQDTNHVQYELMSLFSQRHNRITIVGDPDQSIYAFRSAEVKNVKKMERQYPQTHVVLLEENYRSSGSILTSATELIEQDESRPAKRLLATHTVGERPVLRRLPSPKAEASWIVDEIKRSKVLGGGVLSYSDYAILLRSGSQSQAIELALGKAGIPYRMVGGHKFFDRWEIKVVLNYLRVIGLPDHNDAVINVINVPPRGIGDTTLKELVEEAEKKKIPLWKLVLDVAQGRRKPDTKLKAQPMKGIELFVSLILKARDKLQTSDSSSIVGDLIDFLLSRLSFENYLHKKYPDDTEFSTRWENVEELRFQAAQFSLIAEQEASDLEDALPEVEGVEQQQATGSEATLTKFLANVALATDVKGVENGQADEQVTISTMHAAKGLEWPVVFIASVYEGSMPHSRADDHDEERRLLYVAMTRAQALLYLSCPLKSSSGPGANTLAISPFLAKSKIARLFEAKGATFTFTIVQDIARILRRDCPAETILLAARNTLDRAEDDFYPLDGQDTKPENTEWGFSYTSDPNADSAFPRKRRKVENEAVSFDYQPVAAAGIRTTMSMTGEYSTASMTMSTGFVSASSRMKEMTAQGIRKVTPSTTTIEKSVVSQKKASGRQIASQGNLLSFFTKKAADETQAPDMSVSISQQQDKPNNHSIVKLHSLQNTSTRGNPQLFQRSHSLPKQAMVDRKVRHNPYTGPERIPFADVDESGKPYILLSSSPPRPETKDRSTDQREGVGTNEGEDTTTTPQDMRPAISFHATTMTSCQRSGAQKRTLGVGRPVKGWSSSRVNRPFVAPGRPK